MTFFDIKITGHKFNFDNEFSTDK